MVRKRKWYKQKNNNKKINSHGRGHNQRRKPLARAISGIGVGPTLHTAGAREIWIHQSGFGRREKLYCPRVNVSWEERNWNQATFFIGDCIKYSWKGIYNSKTITHCTKWKIWNILCLQASNLAPKIVLSSSSVAMWDNGCLILNQMCCWSSN